MANTKERVLVKETKMWKIWKRKSKYKLIMEKLEKISTTLYNLEESIAENEKDKDDSIEIKVLKAELQRKNQFIESLLLRMLDGNFNSMKREDNTISKLSPSVQDYIKKKNGEATKNRLP